MGWDGMGWGEMMAKARGIKERARYDEHGGTLRRLIVNPAMYRERREGKEG